VLCLAQCCWTCCLPYHRAVMRVLVLKMSSRTLMFALITSKAVKSALSTQNDDLRRTFDPQQSSPCSKPLYNCTAAKLLVTSP
jgi:hypothetical protein